MKYLDDKDALLGNGKAIQENIVRQKMWDAQQNKKDAMKYDKQYLYNAYNGTSTGDENGELETYENWLEGQLLSRIERLDKIAVVSNQRKLFDNFYNWLDNLTEAEYDDMSLTDKCEKYFFKIDK